MEKPVAEGSQVKLFYTDHFDLPLPKSHRFPMAKYRLLRQRVVQQGIAREEDLRVPDAATDEQLRLVHTPQYVRRIGSGQLTRAEIRRMGFPWSPQLVERSRRSTGATIEAGRAALDEGVAVNLAGGTHHAFSDAAEGFCVFNDTACAARVMQIEGRIRHALIIDCDVHQGNGTAAILQGDGTIFTFSIHAARNFPLRKCDSDLDIALPDGTADDRYLEALADGLHRCLASVDAQLAFYLAGADPFEGDRLGRLKLTKAALAQRDQFVLSACHDAGLPVALTMAGGYAAEVEDIVDIHATTIRLAKEILSFG